MQTKTEIQASTAAVETSVALTPEARALLVKCDGIRKNALDQASHAVYFR